MPRKKRRSPKRSLTMGGIALEVATLLAILMLARPDWIARGFQVVEQYQTTQQCPETTDPTSLPEQTTAPTHSEQARIFPPHIATIPSNERDLQQSTPPAIVIPAGEWLPGYFDIVQHQYQPLAKQPAMPYGHRQYRLSTPMDPWNNPSGRHF